MSVSWNALYAKRLGRMTTSAIREILKVAQAPDIISMAGGWPDAALFPVEQFEEICCHVLREMPRESLQYGLTDGLPALRQALAEYMTEQGIPARMENIVIVSGSQQALDLAGRILLDEGDAVLVERPTFLGALQAFNAYGPRYVTVPVDEAGADPDAIERAIQRERPKFMYLLPTFQNPTGVTMSLQRRQRVVEVAAHYGVPILEDDPYGQLRFAGEALPSLAALDRAGGQENVIYLSTFSKTLAPGLRLAWAVCPPEVAGQFVMAKQGADLHTNTLAQTIALEFLRRGWLPAQVQRIRDTYMARRNAMCDAIAEFFPQEVQYTQPEGGLFLWMTLPEGMSAISLLQDAAKQKVAFVPGAPFFADGGGENTLRLSFACMPPEIIVEGIRRLAGVIRGQMR
jgi:2-aminoadipate transaminase